MKLQNSFRDYTAESSLFVRRALVAFTGILLLTGVLIANLYNVQIVRFNDYQTRSNENRIKLVPIPPSRGIIYDRNGTPLALNRTIYQLEMMPEKVDNVQQTLDALRDVVDLTDDDIAGFKKERARSHRFTSIPVKVNLNEVQVARFAVNQYRFPGVEVKGYKRRYYPYNSALTHVIGYVSKINDKDVDRLDKEGKLANYASTHDIGKLGIERYYEDVLHGQTGYEEVEVNNRGRVIRQLKEVPPQAGRDIYLTLDLKLQQYIETLLAGSRAAVVVTDPRSGAILALVCYGSSVYLAFRDFGPVTGTVVILVILVLSVIATVVSLRAKTWQRFSLKQEIRSSSMPVIPAEELQVGDRGVTLSRLSPMGKVEIGGRTYEAKSQGAYVDQQRDVEVVGFENFSVIVKTIK